jgi:hypothetical protein
MPAFAQGRHKDFKVGDGKTGMRHEEKDGFGKDAFYAVTHRQEGGKA